MTAIDGIWQETFRVRSYETDVTGTASMASICNYLQEAAGNHAHDLGVSVEQMDNQTWVLTRLHVEMARFPSWRQDVYIETWPSGENGLYATREFVLRDDEGDTLGWATSAWLIIDLTRRRPVRIPAFVRSFRVPVRGRALDDTFDRLPVLDTPAEERTFRVRYGDLDLNQHVNNVHYVEWVVEALPRHVREGHHLTSLEIHFRAEATFGDEVRVQTSPAGEDSTFLHRLLRHSDGRDVAHVRTRWVPVPAEPGC